MYCGYITTLRNLKKHSNADRLQCVEVFGQNVIVNLDYYEGQKVVFFPADGQLSLEFATDNNLIRKKDEHGNNIGGYMDEQKRNIKAIRLRGEKSEGIVLPLESLSKYTDIGKLKNGDQISILNGQEICRKYIPKSIKSNQTTTKKTSHKNKSITYPFFMEHLDTNHLVYNLNAFKPGDTVYITRKLHGTSGRTMKTVKVEEKRNVIRRLFHMNPRIYKTVDVISGSRRVVLDKFGNGGYYHDNAFREKYHTLLKDKLPEGMEIFYEIVDYVDENTPIMGTTSNSKVKDKEFVKKFGKETVFSYGCHPGESEMYVYRITMTSSDGTVIELPWETVLIWCERLGLNAVPTLEKFIFTSEEDLLNRVHKYTEGMPVDEIGRNHIAEGVVVRIDNREKFTAYKEKVFEFKVIEGIIKDTSNAPDMEEYEEVLKNE